MSRVFRRVVKFLSLIAREVNEFGNECRVLGDKWYLILIEFLDSYKIIIEKLALITHWDLEPYRFLRAWEGIGEFKGRRLEFYRSYQTVLRSKRIRVIQEYTVLDVSKPLQARDLLQLIFSYM